MLEDLHGAKAIFLHRIDCERGGAAADVFERDGKKRHAFGERCRSGVGKLLVTLLESVGEMLDELGGLKHGHFSFSAWVTRKDMRKVSRRVRV
jgi:hypothetical protein